MPDSHQLLPVFALWSPYTYHLWHIVDSSSIHKPWSTFQINCYRANWFGVICHLGDTGTLWSVSLLFRLSIRLSAVFAQDHCTLSICLSVSDKDYCYHVVQSSVHRLCSRPLQPHCLSVCASLLKTTTIKLSFCVSVFAKDHCYNNVYLCVRLCVISLLSRLSVRPSLLKTIAITASFCLSIFAQVYCYHGVFLFVRLCSRLLLSCCLSVC